MRDHGRPLRRLIVVLGVAVAAACQRQPSGPELQIVTETVKVRLSDALPVRSAIFDGRSVRLVAARGETLGVQVLRASPGEAAVSLTIAGADVAAFVVEHLPVVRPSTAMYGPSTGVGRYPDRLVPAVQPVTVRRAAFFDVAVPVDAPVGDHRGLVVVGDRRVPVVLTVVPVVLPSVAASPRVWAYYDPREVAHDEGADSGTEAAWAIEQRHAALFRAHGVYASPEMRPDDIDRRLPLAAGMPYVPVIFPREEDKLRAAIAVYAEKVRATGQKAFAIPIDEPRSPEAKADVRALAQLARSVGAGRDVLYAVTDTPHDVYGDFVDVYITPYAIRRDRARDPRKQFWTYNGSGPVAGSMILDTHAADLRTWGWIAFRWKVPLWYVWDALYWHDRYSARRKGLARAQIPISPIDRDAVTFDDGGDHGNLDGVLAFPGALPSLRLKILRRGQQDWRLLELAAACDPAATDAIAARMVPVALADAGKPPARGAWPVDEVSWERARQELLAVASQSRCK
jgi:hypothetical protein